MEIRFSLNRDPFLVFPLLHHCSDPMQWNACMERQGPWDFLCAYMNQSSIALSGPSSTIRIRGWTIARLLMAKRLYTFESQRIKIRNYSLSIHFKFIKLKTLYKVIKIDFKVSSSIFLIVGIFKCLNLLKCNDLSSIAREMHGK